MHCLENCFSIKPLILKKKHVLIAWTKGFFIVKVQFRGSHVLFNVSIYLSVAGKWKKRMHEESVWDVEHAIFTHLVVLCTGGMVL